MGDDGEPTADAELTDAAKPVLSPLMQELNSLFEADPEIDEYGLMPGMDGTPFISEEHKLAISTAVVPELVREAKALLGARAHLSSATRVLLLASGDHYTGWNVRKALVVSGELEPSAEVTLTSLVFSVRAKAGNAWAHRRWALARTLPSDGDAASGASCGAGEAAAGGTAVAPPPLLERELDLCADLAMKHSKNYYAWTHRLWVCRRLPASRLRDELKWTADWLRHNFSDRSAAHHAEQVLLLLLGRLGSEPNGDVDELFRTELSRGSELVTKFPGHETLWYHHRCVVVIYLETQCRRATASSSHMHALVKECSALRGDGDGCGGGGDGGGGGDSGGGGGGDGNPWTIVIDQLRVAAKILATKPAWDTAAQHTAARSFAVFIAFHATRILSDGGSANKVQDLVASGIRQRLQQTVGALCDAIARSEHSPFWVKARATLTGSAATEGSSATEAGRGEARDSAAVAPSDATATAVATPGDFYGSTDFWATWKRRKRKPGCKEEGEGCTCFEGVGSVF